jgi:hypothetical protein
MAFCYFSPPSSTLYRSGILHPNPVAALFDGMAAARAASNVPSSSPRQVRQADDEHRLMVWGDFNVRIGTLCNDVPSAVSIVLPPHLSGHADDTFVHSCSPNIPSARKNMDAGVPNVAAALQFLQGMHDAKCVVLNGRAPGDQEGAYTYGQPQHVASASDGGSSSIPAVGGDDALMSGISTVDLVAVSSSLFAHVQSFKVCTFDPSLSTDHRALRTHIALPMVVAQCRVGTSRCRVYRPTTAEQMREYCESLVAHDRALVDILQHMRSGVCGVQDGLQQIATILMRCCGRRRAARTRHAGGSHGPGVPRRRRGVDAAWYDGECRVLRGELSTSWTAHLASPGRLDLRAAAVAARKRYKSAVHRKKYQHEQECQIKQLDVFFSKDQRVFWKEFLGKRDKPCPIADVGEWTRWFQHIMGAVPEVIHLSATEAAARDDLFRAHQQDCRNADCLNDPVEMEEVASILRTLPIGKSADAMGLTCELLKLAAMPPNVYLSDNGEVHSQHNEIGPAAYVSEPLLQCVLWLLQNLRGPVPSMFYTSKLTPVPKGRILTEEWDKNKYRGISVSSIFARVADRLMHARLDQYIEVNALRAPTQCGFRKEQGALDALFTLNHCIQRAQWQKKRLYVVFVDFRKAFDTVRRDVMLDRCRQLAGVHGRFLGALCLLYEKVSQKVVVNGVVGEAFDAHVGTKQGSELISPLTVWYVH